jgi:transposase-like protein
MGQENGAMIRLWHNAWEQFISFLSYEVEIRKVAMSTLRGPGVTEVGGPTLRGC